MGVHCFGDSLLVIKPTEMTEYTAPDAENDGVCTAFRSWPPPAGLPWTACSSPNTDLLAAAVDADGNAMLIDFRLGAILHFWLPPDMQPPEAQAHLLVFDGRFGIASGDGSACWLCEESGVWQPAERRLPFDVMTSPVIRSRQQAGGTVAFLSDRQRTLGAVLSSAFFDRGSTTTPEFVEFGRDLDVVRTLGVPLQLAADGSEFFYAALTAVADVFVVVSVIVTRPPPLLRGLSLSPARLEFFAVDTGRRTTWPLPDAHYNFVTIAAQVAHAVSSAGVLYVLVEQPGTEFVHVMAFNSAGDRLWQTNVAGLRPTDSGLRLFAFDDGTLVLRRRDIVPDRAVHQEILLFER